MKHIALLPDVNPVTLKLAFYEAFPFPSHSLVFGHKIMKTLPSGLEVLLLATSSAKAEPYVMKGLAVEDPGEASPIWMIHPPRAQTSPRTIIMSLLLVILFSVTLQTINASAQRKLSSLQSQQKKKRDSGAALSPLSSELALFLPSLIGKIPVGVEVISMDLDFRKRTLLVKARAPHYASVSDTVMAMSQLSTLRQTRSSQAQLIQERDRPFVDFTIESILK